MSFFYTLSYMEMKSLFALAATIIAVVSYVPYLRDMYRGKTKPHAFSWFIWSLLGFIAGYAQIRAGGGVGSSVVLVTSGICLWIALAAYRQGAVKITRGDWITFVAALLAIPLWVATKRPVLSVVLVTAIDTIGYWPTIRKSLKHPEHETLSTHYLSTLKHCLTLVALERYNLTTVLYPASLAVTTGLFVVLLLSRGRATKL